MDERGQIGSLFIGRFSEGAAVANSSATGYGTQNLERSHLQRRVAW